MPSDWNLAIAGQQGAGYQGPVGPAGPQGPAGPINPANLANIVLEVALNNNLTIGTASTWTTIRYDTKITDSQNAYNPATGIFTPTQAGVYAVSASVGATWVAGGWQGIAILKNGSLTNAESQSNKFIGNFAFTGSITASALIYCNGTSDTIQIQAIQSTNTTWLSSANAAQTVNMVASLLQVGPQGPTGQGFPTGGNTGQILTKNSATNYDASWQTSTSTLQPGARVLLATAAVAPPNAVATVDMFYNFTNAYDEYEIDVYDLQMSTSGNWFGIRESWDGSTFDASSNYYYAYQTFVSNNTGGYGGGGPSAMGFIGVGSVVGTQYLSYTKAKFAMPWTTDRNKYFMSESVMHTSGGITRYIVSMANVGAAAIQPIKGLRFMDNGGGNITRGVFNLYGIVKASSGS